MSGTAAILLAGGSGSRLRNDVNKVYLDLAGRRMLAHSLSTLLVAGMEPVVVVVRSGDEDLADEVISGASSSHVVRTTGGPTRTSSEHCGLEELSDAIERGSTDVVLIHDGARPLITVDLVTTIAETARRVGGAVPAMPMEDPIVDVAEGRARAVDIRNLVRMQTPQGFAALPLLEAFRAAAAVGFEGADTAETIERFTDLAIATVPGEMDNVKVTFVEDLFVAEELLAARDRSDQ